MVVIRQNVLFQFVKKFLDRLGFLSREVGSCWPWGETFDQCLDRCFVISFGDLRRLLHEPSHEVPQWLCLSACSYTNLMLPLLCHGTSEMLA
jgi:hypothetical protein